MAGPGHADRGCAAAVVSTAEGLTAAKAARRRELWCGQLCCAGGGVWPTNALAELAEEQAEFLPGRGAQATKEGVEQTTGRGFLKNWTV